MSLDSFNTQMINPDSLDCSVLHKIAYITTCATNVAPLIVDEEVWFAHPLVLTNGEEGPDMVRYGQLNFIIKIPMEDIHHITPRELYMRLMREAQEYLEDIDSNYC